MMWHRNLMQITLKKLDFHVVGGVYRSEPIWCCMVSGESWIRSNYWSAPEIRSMLWQKLEESPWLIILNNRFHPLSISVYMDISIMRKYGQLYRDKWIYRYISGLGSIVLFYLLLWLLILWFICKICLYKCISCLSVAVFVKPSFNLVKQLDLHANILSSSNKTCKYPYTWTIK